MCALAAALEVGEHAVAAGCAEADGGRPGAVGADGAGAGAGSRSGRAARRSGACAWCARRRSRARSRRGRRATRKRSGRSRRAAARACRATSRRPSSATPRPRTGSAAAMAPWPPLIRVAAGAPGSGPTALPAKTAAAKTASSVAAKAARTAGALTGEPYHTPWGYESAILPATTTGGGPMRTLKLAATTAVAVLAIVPGSALADKGPGLWRVYDQTLSKARYIDLTHDLTPQGPVWKGFGPATFKPDRRPGDGCSVHVRQGRLRGDGVRALDRPVRHAARPARPLGAGVPGHRRAAGDLRGPPAGRDLDRPAGEAGREVRAAGVRHSAVRAAATAASRAARW